MSRLPTLNPKQVITALEQTGFVRHHQTGSHLFLWHPVRKRLTSVPIHPRDLKRGLMMKIIRQAGLTQKEFQDLL